MCSMTVGLKVDWNMTWGVWRKLDVIARNLGHETPRAVTRGNLNTDRDAEVYRDLYAHSRKMANISLRLKENKNVQLSHNRLLYYGANYVKIKTK